MWGEKKITERRCELCVMLTVSFVPLSYEAEQLTSQISIMQNEDLLHSNNVI